MKFYAADISHLSDADLKNLQAEIEDSGVLSHDENEWDPGSWESQAWGRWMAIVEEMRRRHPEPEGKGLKFTELDAYIHRHITQQNADMLFNDSMVISRLLKRK